MGCVLCSSAWAQAFRHLNEGDVAPGFKLKTVSGQEVEYAAPPEVAVVLSFVRMGQEKSEAVMRELARLDPKVLEKSQVLALVTNPQEGDVAAWVKNLGVTFPVLVDQNEEVYSKYGVMVAPQTAIMAPDGKLRGEVGGHTADFKSSVEDKLRELLGMEKVEDKSAAVAKDLPLERKKAMRELQDAKVKVKRKMKAKAIPQAKEAVASDDTYVEAHVFYANLLLDEGGPENLAEAEKQLNRAAELEPANAAVKPGLARIKASKGDYDGAVAMLEEAAKISPKAAHLYYYLGRIHQEAGKLDKAAEAYRLASEKLLDSEGQ
jgi:tetratricopeptide (TPR) repeat protein